MSQLTKMTYKLSYHFLGLNVSNCLHYFIVHRVFVGGQLDHILHKFLGHLSRFWWFYLSIDEYIHIIKITLYTLLVTKSNTCKIFHYNTICTSIFSNLIHFAMFSVIWHKEHDLITFPCNLCIGYLYYNWMKLICKQNIHIQTLETPSAAEKEIKRIKIRNS